MPLYLSRVKVGAFVRVAEWEVEGERRHQIGTSTISSEDLKENS